MPQQYAVRKLPFLRYESDASNADEVIAFVVAVDRFTYLRTDETTNALVFAPSYGGERSLMPGDVWLDNEYSGGPIAFSDFETQYGLLPDQPE